MIMGPWSSLLPPPKHVEGAAGSWRPASAECLTVRVHSAAAAGVAAWLVRGLAEHCGRSAVTVEAGGPASADLHIGHLDDLTAASIAPATWRQAAPFASAVGREQGYILEVRSGGIVLGAQALPGLQHAAATLLQVLAGVAPAAVPCARIEDWPDVRFRVADWLLNAEINRWGLERGDGREALAARMRRKLDLAARLKANVIWFDGFGWDAERTPGYAGFVRDLATEARERHIRLAHAGYGGGYGFAYQKHFIYDSPYHGRILENRSRYPDGPAYDCVGHPRYAASWRFGTCLSNPALAQQKLAELTDFVRRCQPGMLYIHDIDTGDFGLAHEGWKRRCPACRARWPDDAMASATGAAAAYAAWYRQAATAIGAAASDDASYVPARDCEVVFVGPVYTGPRDTDEIWQQECDYVAMVSDLMGPFPNVQFGLREQVVPAPGYPSRVAMLQDRLARVGHGHGAFVVAFTGGDNYFSDTLVPAAAALQGSYAGASTIYVKNLGAVAEPAQALCATYAWNAAAPGALAAPTDREAALGLLTACQKGHVVPPGWNDADGPVHDACRLLYGPGAAMPMARLVGLGLPDGLAPVATGWGAVSREVALLLSDAPAPADAAARPERWRRRAQITTAAMGLLEEALTAAPLDPLTRGDLRWLRTRLGIGRRFAELLASAWEWRLDAPGGARAAAQRILDEIEDDLRAHVPRDTVDPVGGDVAVWSTMAKKLRAALE